MIFTMPVRTNPLGPKRMIGGKGFLVNRHEEDRDITGNMPN